MRGAALILGVAGGTGGRFVGSFAASTGGAMGAPTPPIQPSH